MKTSIQVNFIDFNTNGKNDIILKFSVRGDLTDEQIIALHKLKKAGAGFMEISSAQKEIEDYGSGHDDDEGAEPTGEQVTVEDALKKSDESQQQEDEQQAQPEEQQEQAEGEPGEEQPEQVDGEQVPEEQHETPQEPAQEQEQPQEQPTPEEAPSTGKGRSRRLTKKEKEEQAKAEAEAAAKAEAETKEQPEQPPVNDDDLPF
ncbi:hypothetical protein [Paenibacillus elgii]|uniref:hypothetical protein n=1 Tax=Paenibacillus elgii TaxID=189691 RepID=UPI000248C5FB|nr:hypothetical protein [Paenibacillus elgii]